MTTTLAPRATRGIGAGAPSFRRSFVLHVATEFTDFWRSFVSLAFIVFMPVAFYVGFGFAYRAQGDAVQTVGEHTIRQADLSYAGVLAFGLLSVLLANVAISLAFRRHRGTLKRFRTTPVRPWVVMGAFLANSFVTAVILVSVLTLIGVVGLGVHLSPERLPQLGAAFLLAFVCIAPLGAALSLVPPTADAAVPIANAIFFPLAFLSGAFFSLPLGAVGDAIVAWLPGKPLVTLFQGALAQTGPSWDIPSMLLLLAWGTVGALVSLRWFRWASDREPRAPRSRTRAAADDER